MKTERFVSALSNQSRHGGRISIEEDERPGPSLRHFRRGYIMPSLPNAKPYAPALLTLEMYLSVLNTVSIAKE